MNAFVKRSPTLQIPGLKMHARSAPPQASERALVANCDLAALVLRADGSPEFVNSRAKARIVRSWLDGAGPRLVRLAAEGRAEPMQVLAPDGRLWRATPHAAPLGQRVVVVFDEGPRGEDTVGALRGRVAELERLSVTDVLTGLWNRRQFDALAVREISVSESQLAPLSLVILDLDRLSTVNDRHGLAAGDAILRKAAHRLRAVSRRSDLLFRWGGEEFAALLPATSSGAATVVAERLRAAMAVRTSGGTITVSAGLAEHEAGESAEHWFGRAHEALCASKRMGRDRVTTSPGGASLLWRPQAQESALRLVWSEFCVSGNAAIDEEHRALFDGTNALLAGMTTAGPCAPAVLEQVDCLLSAVARHFVDEEEILERIRYPGLEPHRRQHQALLAEAARLRGSLQSGEASAGDVVEFLAYDVINRHILKSDRQYFPFVAAAAQREGALPR